MLRWALIFFVVAIIAALFGFTGIAAGAESIAQVLFFIFVVLFRYLLSAARFSQRKNRSIALLAMAYNRTIIK